MEQYAELVSVAENSALTKEHKIFISEEYLSVLGKKINPTSKCKNCWNDALAELILATRPNKYEMCRGAYVVFNGVGYTRLNINDMVAQQILHDQPELSHYFNIKK
jgi:hypothetical protein